MKGLPEFADDSVELLTDCPFALAEQGCDLARAQASSEAQGEEIAFLRRERANEILDEERVSSVVPGFGGGSRRGSIARSLR